MISPKKLIKMARKWQKVAAMKRKRISYPQSSIDNEVRTSYVANKGHFVVYTADRKRFVFPMRYLNNSIIRELLIISEEEFGLPGDGPITLPCDAIFMEYITSVIQRSSNRDIEKAILMSITTSRCSLYSSLHVEQYVSQFPVCSY